MSTSVARHHTDWLSLIEVSGPFLTLPVLKRALPQGLEPVVPDTVDELRRAYEEWQDDAALHGEWVRWVLLALLGFDQESLRAGPEVPATLDHVVPEHGETLRPDMAVLDPSQNGKVVPRLFVTDWPAGTELNDKPTESRWAATPLDRMTELLRGTGVRLGLVTNGERWTLVHAALGGPTTYANWEAGIWLEDRPTLNAFVTLLSARRFFAVAEPDTLEALFEESANAEQEVTEQLGLQVRHAVELLVDAFGHANREHDGKLLEGVPEREIYSAAVTIMMRLVFLLCAEERGLFLLGDPLYDNTYAVSTLRAQLQEEADRHGEEPLERRSSAWHRLLATFRMVHGGVEHENLRLPAYGGTLFDPDRFPFLEGRNADEPWHKHRSRPLPLDDRTVLHILDAVQVLRFRERFGVTEARRLSFRALDVEQIGHVYEGLLDHAVVEATAPAVGLDGKLEPEISLVEVEKNAQGNVESFVSWLAAETGRSKRAVEKALTVAIEPHERALLLAACDMDARLADRIGPFHALLRHDLRGLPQVYLAGGVYVTKALERRSSGTYYTPRNLAEEMVRHALEPLVYNPGPPQGADAADWKLRPPAELLELKVCDMAMGSGAFLVGSCRYLAGRLLEAWEEANGREITIEGEPASERPDELVVPDDPEDRSMLALRLVAERCLYGVDRNPMAVEMAKLSLWLITLAKDRPFSFVDHALRCGDSLLGITDLAQIENFHVEPVRGRNLFHSQLFDYRSIFAPAVERAIDKRRALEAFPVVTLRDAQEKERLFHEAEQELEALKIVADAIIGAALSTASQGDEALDGRLLSVADDVAAALDPERKDSDRKVRLDSLYWDAVDWLNTGRPIMHEDRRTFHWPLEFPEVFVRGGFDAIVGNPPFMGGGNLVANLGLDLERYLKRLVPESRGMVDLASYFVRRADVVVRGEGTVGLLGPQNLSATANRKASLEVVLTRGRQVIWARSRVPWPGNAAVEICMVCLGNDSWRAIPQLNGAPVPRIGPGLEADVDLAAVHRLQPWLAYSEGTHLGGTAFVRKESDWQPFVGEEPELQRYLRPYVNADILTSYPDFRCDLLAVDLGETEKTELLNVARTVAFLEQHVTLERANQTRQIHEPRPWLFSDKRTRSYEAARRLPRILVLATLSKFIPIAFVSPEYLFSKTLKFMISDDAADYALLQSSIFIAWVVATSPKRGDRVAFSTRNSLDTFAPPQELRDQLRTIGEECWVKRKMALNARSCGLTDLLNLVHDPDDMTDDVTKLREVQKEMDERVAAAYGWDVEVDHGFHKTPQGIRYTIGPLARVEVLHRLLELNYERYAAEVAAGQHDKKGAKRTRGRFAVVSQTTLDGWS